MRHVCCLRERAPACRSVLEQLLDAANWAPTHGRTEPWKFVVLGRAQQEELLDLTMKVCCAMYFLSVKALFACAVPIAMNS